MTGYAGVITINIILPESRLLPDLGSVTNTLSKGMELLQKQSQA